MLSAVSRHAEVLSRLHVCLQIFVPHQRAYALKSVHRMTAHLPCQMTGDSFTLWQYR